MTGAYQAPEVVVTAGFATMARTRMPERAAVAQVWAVVNMGAREPQAPASVNAIRRLRVQRVASFEGPTGSRGRR